MKDDRCFVHENEHHGLCGSNLPPNHTDKPLSVTCPKCVKVLFDKKLKGK